MNDIMSNIYEVFYNKVIQWNEVATDRFMWDKPEFKELYWNLLTEEFNELRKGYKNNDPVETADGLCDVFVVLSMLLEITRDTYPSCSGFDHGLTPINKFIALAEPIIFEKRDNSVLFLMSALCSCFDYTTLPIESCLAEVIRSNWTKFPKEQDLKDWYGDDIVAAVNSAIDDITTKYPQYKDVVSIQKNEFFVFKADHGNGKIMKWAGYTPPNLKQYLDKLDEDV